MATFNGARFVRQQLLSILEQSIPVDEIVVVDDGSTDRTCEYIRSLADPRIHLIEQETNKGVLLAFEEAIRHSSGNVLFLSDQDDIWEQTKVQTVMQVFRENPDVKVVVTDASFIDEDGLQLPNSYFGKIGKFTDGFVANVLRCKYLGCAMAFRSSLLSEILPFPAGHGILHDIWIGTKNKLAGGRTCFIDQKLVRYRRHSSNVTGNAKLSRFRQLQNRLDLLFALAIFRFRTGSIRKPISSRQ